MTKKNQEYIESVVLSMLVIITYQAFDLWTVIARKPDFMHAPHVFMQR